LGTDYGRLRLWGTIGYIVSVLCFTLWLWRGGSFYDVPMVGLALIASYMLAALFNSESPIDLHRTPPSLADAGRLLAQPAFLVFLLAQLVHWMALQPFYLLFTIHLTDLNLRDYAGVSVAVSAATEVVLFFCFGALCRRVPILLLMGFAGVVSSFRWFCNSNVQSGPAFVAIQAMHCFSFGACYAGSIVYMERTVPPQLLATGRALFSSLVLGLGGVLGVLLAGTLYDAGNGKFGGGKLAFRSAGFLDMLTPVLLFVAWRLAAPTVRTNSEPAIAVSLPQATD
jgi:PPP family 3-phenylpropionic acid transporter